MDAAGRLTHSNSPDPLPPFNNVGVQILKPEAVQGPPGPFSIVPIWKRLSAEGRLYGAAMDGFAMHVSDPPGLAAAEAALLAEAKG
jgi:MurNAc alpha-1-phosphate uridylyltransferase